MLALLTSAAVPGIAAALVLIVGFDLRIEDFRRVSLYPKTVVVATLRQILLLPLVAVGLVRLPEPSDEH